MEKLVAGSVVAVLFPFSDLSDSKLRPALVVATAEYNNLILCQITSKKYSSDNAIKLSVEDFEIGKLPFGSYIRPDKIFTADLSIVKKNLGIINEVKLGQVRLKLKYLFDL